MREIITGKRSVLQFNACFVNCWLYWIWNRRGRVNLPYRRSRENILERQLSQLIETKRPGNSNGELPGACVLITLTAIVVPSAIIAVSAPVTVGLWNRAVRIMVPGSRMVSAVSNGGGVVMRVTSA